MLEQRRVLQQHKGRESANKSNNAGHDSPPGGAGAVGSSKPSRVVAPRVESERKGFNAARRGSDEVLPQEKVKLFSLKFCLPQVVN